MAITKGGIGRKRHRITIQEAVEPEDYDPFVSGDAAQWNDIITMWASIDAASSRDVFNQGEQGMQVSHVITIRYPGKNVTVGAGCRVLFGTRVFSIVKGITNEEERNRELQFFGWELNPTQGGLTNA